MKEKAKAMVLASFVGIPGLVPMGLRCRAYRREFGAWRASSRKARFLHHKTQGQFTITAIRPSSCSSRSHPEGLRSGRLRGSLAEALAAYTGYYDKATKGTLQNFAAGLGPEHPPPFQRLAGATRIGPRLSCGRIRTARRRCPDADAMTHGDSLASTREFHCRAAVRITRRGSPRLPHGRSEERFSDHRLQPGEGRIAGKGEETSPRRPVRPNCYTPAAFLA